jgi:hypothetical protein
MIAEDSLIDKQKNIISKKINNEYILVPLTGNVANMESLYTLNETAAFLWGKIDGTKNITRLAEEVVKEFNVDMLEAMIDTKEFIDEIKGLLIIK